MQWSSALSTAATTEDAVEAVATTLLDALGAAPDLVFVFASDAHRIAYDRLPGLLAERLGAGLVLGCSASGVIADAREVEEGAALAVTAACLPGVELSAWRLEAGDLAPGSAHSAQLTTLAAGPRPHFVVLADPFSFPTERLLRSIEQGFAGSVVSGGLASGGAAPGECALFLDRRHWYSGAVVLALSGAIEVLGAVAQGCRPVGEPMFVSACAGNRLDGLDGRSPLAVLDDLFAQADAHDRSLMRHSLFLGLAMRPGASRHVQGDFLVRNVIGGDPASGALWIGAELREHQVVQFQLRDRETSRADLERVLDRLAGELAGRPPSGGLLFSCTGRGAGLYGVPGHDAGACRAQLGGLPLGGFFCNGEIGQVEGQPFVHGYTSALAVFRAPG
ncbi:MAG: FIST C-terminal domain-containing protein [Gammaproteobacteria bacterium]|nr:FIST C-terminal domain-containing protein [Gammaproteobacteria bacterium]MCP5200169.1 FIST C-terminal domain-containing protein [Gammaproteobacteria bacterium]